MLANLAIGATAAGATAAGAMGLATLRIADALRTRHAWRSLSGHALPARPLFEARMLSGLPDPVRAFFSYTIEEGAVLGSVAEVAMSGELGLGDARDPKYMPMHARQIIAPPYGLVWIVDVGSGLMRLSGSDGFCGGRSWVRFWFWNAVPVVRAGGSSDHLRAALGRVVAEAVFFAPASLLPENGVVWEAVGSHTARASVMHLGMVQTVDVTVDDEGRPHTVVIPRWSDANMERRFRLQPFGGTLSEFRRFGGYMLPTRIDGGNFIGTPEYFPFYKARIERVRFLPAT